MGAIILGKMHLRWCDKCNVPVLEQSKCSSCRSETRPVKITPPGDARPAFESDVARIRSLVDSQFGEGTGRLVIPEGAIVLLNKAPDIDRMDEVIVDGAVVGAVRFALASGEKFLPRPEAAEAISDHASKGWVLIDPIAADAVRNKSASTLAVGVLECDPGIEAGDELIVLDEPRNAVSVGVSKMSASDMMQHKRGTAVKTRWTVKEPRGIEGRPATWAQATVANKETIDRRTREAADFIKKTVKDSGLPVAVSYSGGKDSLATLLLVLDAGITPDLMFVDTGLEFEETRKNVQDTASSLGLKLIVESAGDAFWKNIGRFGPPAKDFRWCCKTCKLGPATQLIQKNYPGGVLSFIGQRAYESQQRAEKGRIWRNPWTPNQLAASPIQKWSALHVWLYLFSKGARYNPLYEKGLERIGCFMCPATDLAELRKVREISADYARWQEFLTQHAEKTHRPPHWLEYDLWRWKRLPKSVLDELGPSAKTETFEVPSDLAAEPLEFRSTSGYSPCVEGLSMEGIFSRALPMDRVANLLNIIGPVTTSPDGNIAEVRSITVFGEGPVMVKAKDEEALRQKSAMLKEVVFRAVECAGCGICIGRCERGSLRLEGTIVIDPEKCDHCGRCLGPCPAVKFRADDLDI